MTTLEFSKMVQQYQALVYTVCHQLVPDVQEAQDLTQETFLAAWRAIDRCPPGYEKQWLARIAANKAKDYLRSAWAAQLCGRPPKTVEAQVYRGKKILAQQITRQNTGERGNVHGTV